jgi:hypothetical protein
LIFVFDKELVSYLKERELLDELLFSLAERLTLDGLLEQC